MAVLNPVSFNAYSVVQAALADIGVVSLEEGNVPSAAQAQDGLNRLNAMISLFQTNNLTIPFVAREVFDLVANQTSYTIGTGGDFDTTRPLSILGASLLLTASSPDVEVPLAILTDDAWQRLQVKDLTAAQPTALYYNQTFDDNFGTVYLWPVPNTATNDLVIYRNSQVAGFSNLTTALQFPPGYFEFFESNLAVRLCVPYRVQPTPSLAQWANATMASIKRQNHKTSDLSIDPALTNTPAVGYNIQTGTGG